VAEFTRGLPELRRALLEHCFREMSVLEQQEPGEVDLERARQVARAVRVADSLPTDGRQ
jgi:hypothetical protein